MARDYTKYTIEGVEENLNKRQLVFSIIKDYLDQNECTYSHLKEIFPDEIQGSKGVIKLKSEINDFKRFSKESLKTSDGEDIFISNQWGENINDFISLAENLGYIIEKDGDIEDTDEESLMLPMALRISNYDQKWGRFITLRYQNSADCDTDYSYIKIDTSIDAIIPLNPDNDDETKKWFGVWEAMLNDYNQEEYSSGLIISFSNDREDDYGVWRVYWHDLNEGLDDGEYPNGVSDSTINKLFSNKWFSDLFNFLKVNI